MDHVGWLFCVSSIWGLKSAWSVNVLHTNDSVGPVEENPITNRTKLPDSAVCSGHDRTLCIYAQ